MTAQDAAALIMFDHLRQKYNTCRNIQEDADLLDTEADYKGMDVYHIFYFYQKIAPHAGKPSLTRAVSDAIQMAGYSAFGIFGVQKDLALSIFFPDNAHD